MTPDGSMNMQLDKINEKVNKWSNRIHSSRLNKTEAYVGANTTIFRTVTYILPGTSFTETQCHQIECNLYRHLLGKLGISTKFLLAFKYAPHKFQGAAMLEVYVAQLIDKLTIFLHHANLSSQLGKTYTVSMGGMQVEISSTHHFFSLPYHEYGKLTPVSWLNRLWESLSKYGVSVRNSKSSLTPPHQNDFA